MASVLKQLRERAEMHEYRAGRDALRAAKGLLVEPFRMDLIVKKVPALASLADAVWHSPSLGGAVVFVRNYLDAAGKSALANLRWLQKYG